MSLIKSISGIRGTIGGQVGHNLTPVDIVACVSGYGQILISQFGRPKVLVGRDGRISGDSVLSLVIHTLVMMGIDVVSLDLSTTPTVEMAVQESDAHAGIIITASHNPKHWNALKFLNQEGEFISADTGAEIIATIQKEYYRFADVDSLGKLTHNDQAIEQHIDAILSLDIFDLDAIRRKAYKVVVDCINSTGAISVNRLLDRIGVEYVLINSEINGEFAHNPEPLPKHLEQLGNKVVETQSHLGIAVDPDVDRLAFVMEDGQAFGEEYTLVAAADFVLSKKGAGNTVSNLSSTMALADVTSKYGGQYYGSAVGEVNVVGKMKEVSAIIGGEGNGGVIYPELHYGRDALLGIVMMLNLLADTDMSLTELKAKYPSYAMAKKKIQLTPAIDIDYLLLQLEKEYSDEHIDKTDGVKIIFEKSWVHLRKSNTEPIIRVYTEAQTGEKADALADEIIEKAQDISSSSN